MDRVERAGGDRAADLRRSAAVSHEVRVAGDLGEQQSGGARRLGAARRRRGGRRVVSVRGVLPGGGGAGGVVAGGRAAGLAQRRAAAASAMPDYVYRSSREGDWTKVWMETQAPDEGGRRWSCNCILSNAPQGTVWWDDISLDQIPDPGPRPVSVASINLRPRQTKSAGGERAAVPGNGRGEGSGEDGCDPAAGGHHGGRQRQVVPGGRGDDSGADDEAVGRGRAAAVGVYRGGDLRARRARDLQHGGVDRPRGKCRGQVSQGVPAARRGGGRPDSGQRLPGVSGRISARSG